MSDETSRVVEPSSPAPRSSGKSELANVEFLDTALCNPLNALRAKLKELEELPEGCRPRRVVIITDLVDEDVGRSLDVSWSDVVGEASYDTLDSVLSLLLRIQLALTSSDPE